MIAVAGEPLLGGDTVPVGGGDDGVGEPHDDVAVVPPSPRRRRRRKAIKRVLLVVMVLLIPVGYSYARALTGPGSDSLQARTVEWARDHHLGGVVDRVEKYWYAHHQARIGGTPASTALGIQPAAPVVPVVDPAVATSAAPVVTAPVAAPVAARAADSWVPSSGANVSGRVANPPAPLLSPAPAPLAQEGQWSGVGPRINGGYGTYATLIRPDAVHTSVLDAVVWFDPHLVSLRQYPGTRVPGAPWDRADFVEPAQQAELMAVFSGGFRLQDSRGGMFLGGHELQPLRDGAATFVIDGNGVPNIGVWGRDFTSTVGLDSARQNLDLIVDGGVVSPQLTTDPNRAWGFTGPANRDAVWRSGAGITADGALVWVGGDGLSIVSLAQMLVRAGAVRGMQLDINREWVQFNTYAANATGTVHGKRLLTGMEHSNDRYLTEDSRDFIAVFKRP